MGRMRQVSKGDEPLGTGNATAYVADASGSVLMPDYQPFGLQAPLPVTRGQTQKTGLT